MARYIMAEALKRDLCDMCKAMDPQFENCPGCMTTNIIDRQPAVEVTGMVIEQQTASSMPDFLIKLGEAAKRLKEGAENDSE